MRLWVDVQELVFIHVIRILTDAAVITLSLLVHLRLCVCSQLQKASKKQSSMFFHS